VVTVDAVRTIAEGLPRSYEVIVRGRVKFRVGKIVWLAFSLDETIMGFAFPKEAQAGSRGVCRCSAQYLTAAGGLPHAARRTADRRPGTLAPPPPSPPTPRTASPRTAPTALR
jgi:hypothetical protein